MLQMRNGSDRDRQPDSGRAAAAPAENERPPNVGENLKRLRRHVGLSLENLAKRSRVSRAMLGQIESGRSIPTVTVVWKIARALGVDTVDLISAPSQRMHAVVPAAQARSVKLSGGGFSLHTYACSGLNQPFEFNQIEIAPGHREDFPPLAHAARATFLVSSGRVEVHLPDEVVRLGEGDAVLFNADLPHAFSNHESLPAKGYLVVGTPQNPLVERSAETCAYHDPAYRSQK